MTKTTATVVNTHNAFSGFVGSLCRLDVDRFILICSLTSFLPFFFFTPGLNDELVQLLLNRDELQMEQDAMLVDIEDYTR